MTVQGTSAYIVASATPASAYVYYIINISSRTTQVLKVNPKRCNFNKYTGEASCFNSLVYTSVAAK